MVSNILPEPCMIYSLKKPSTYTTCHCVEFGQTLWPLLRNLSCYQDQDHVHSTYICCSYTGSMQKMFSIHLKMFYSYIGNIHKNMFDRINAPSSWKCLSSKLSIVERRHGPMQKLFIKKEKKIKIKKWWWEKWIQKCPRYLKQWVLRCPPKK